MKKWYFHYTEENKSPYWWKVLVSGYTRLQTRGCEPQEIPLQRPLTWQQLIQGFKQGGVNPRKSPSKGL
jgi:hypothetical protein